MAVSDYSKVPGENTSISGINIGEGCPPGNMNDALRQLMADVRAMSETSDSGKAPVNHASTAETYGVATGGKFGHVKLSDYSNADKGIEEGTAVTPKAVQKAVDTLTASIADVQTAADAKAPISHATAATTYGVGTGGLYGHVKLSDYANADRGVPEGFAATPKALAAIAASLGARIDEGGATCGDGWVKLSCGIMVCWGTTPSLNVDTASTTTARTFGQNFKTGTTPTVLASIAAGGEKWEQARWKVETVSNSGFTLTAIAQGNMAKGVSFNWVAVGVWK